MKSIILLLGIVLLLEPVFAAGSDTADGSAPSLSLEVINKQALGKLTRWDYRLDEEGKPWFAYYTADGALVTRLPSGAEVDLTPKTRVSSMSGLAIDTTQDGLGLMWRDKLPRKGLYFMPEIGADGSVAKLRLIDNKMEPLTRFKLANSGGETFFLWYGEKSNEPYSTKNYNYYFRYLDGDDEKLSDITKVMPGIYPTWIVTDEQIPVFSWHSVNKKRQVMVMRSFDREKKAFGPRKVIVKDAPIIGPFLFSFESAGRWFLMWVAHQGEDFRDLLLEGAYSDDRGENWRRFAFEDLEGLDFSQIDTASDGKGNLLIVLSGSWRLRDEGDAKNTIYLLRSGDNGTTWDKPLDLRSPELASIEADFPSVTFGSKEGAAMVVWQDWRNIRSGVYASYSSDSGATWSPAAPLEKPGSANFGLSFGVNALAEHDGVYHVAGTRYAGDELELRDLVMYSFTPDELQRYGEYVLTNAKPATEERLRERIAAYWQAMQDEDYEVTYGLLDPFYRGRRPLKRYLSTTGKIKYHSNKIDSVVVQNNIAKIQVTVEASVPEFKMSTGATFSRPKQDYTFSDTWVYVGDDWYREYFEEQGDLRFTRY